MMEGPAYPLFHGGYEEDTQNKYVSSSGSWTRRTASTPYENTLMSANVDFVRDSPHQGPHSRGLRNYAYQPSWFASNYNLPQSSGQDARMYDSHIHDAQGQCVHPFPVAMNPQGLDWKALYTGPLNVPPPRLQDPMLELEYVGLSSSWDSSSKDNSPIMIGPGPLRKKEVPTWTNGQTEEDPLPMTMGGICQDPLASHCRPERDGVNG